MKVSCSLVAVLIISISVLSSVYGKDDQFMTAAKQMSFMANFMGMKDTEFVELMQMADNGYRLFNTFKNMYYDFPQISQMIATEFGNMMPMIFNMSALTGNCEMARMAMETYNGGNLCGETAEMPSIKECGSDYLPPTMCMGQSLPNMDAIQACLGTAWDSTVKYVQSNPTKCIQTAVQMMLNSPWAPKN